MFSDQTGPEGTSSPNQPQGPCPRCGEALRAAMHLPKRVGQPAYDIFRCVGCGFLAWVALGPQSGQ